MNTRSAIVAAHVTALVDNCPELLQGTDQSITSSCETSIGPDGGQSNPLVRETNDMLEKITARNKIVDAVPALRVKVEQLEREIKCLKRVISAVKVSARKGKGFGKKKASTIAQVPAYKSATRSNICRNYNNLKCPTEPCPHKFKHVCSRCLGDHTRRDPSCSYNINHAATAAAKRRAAK